MKIEKKWIKWSFFESSEFFIFQFFHVTSSGGGCQTLLDIQVVGLQDLKCPVNRPVSSHNIHKVHRFSFLNLERNEPLRRNWVSWSREIPADHKKEIYFKWQGEQRNEKTTAPNFSAIDPEKGVKQYVSHFSYRNFLLLFALMLMHEPRLFIPFLSSFFFHISDFFFKNTSQTIFPFLIVMARGCSETCIRCRCLSLGNKDTNGKKYRALFLRGAAHKKKGWLGGGLMEMVQITHKKMIWKRRIEENFFHDNEKRAKIKIEKMWGAIVNDATREIILNRSIFYE